MFILTPVTILYVQLDSRHHTWCSAWLPSPHLMFSLTPVTTLIINPIKLTTFLSCSFGFTFSRQFVFWVIAPYFRPFFCVSRCILYMHNNLPSTFRGVYIVTFHCAFRMLGGDSFICTWLLYKTVYIIMYCQALMLKLSSWFVLCLMEYK